MLQLRRTYRFCASHRYWRDDWPAERNHGTFGRCALPHGHGHNYRLTLVVEGEPDADTGMIVDLTRLDAVVGERILDKFDHRNLNVEVPHFRSTLPTTENLARYVFAEIAPRMPRGRLAAVEIDEDEFLSAVCAGE